MKRIIALVLAVLMIGAVLCACGEKTKTDANGSNTTSGSKSGDGSKAVDPTEIVTAKVDPKYDEGFAEKYAKSVTTDENGEKVYDFEEQAYENYLYDYNNKISSQVTDDVLEDFGKDYGQYTYINDEKQAVIIGVNPGKYDEKTAAAAAEKFAQQAFPYFQGLTEPVSTVKVIFCNANNQEDVYGTFEFEIK